MFTIPVANTWESIVVPFTDGVHGMQIFVPLKKAIENKGLEVFKSFEKNVTLTEIDDAWKEHLREMDELKQSVQNAVYEQKDPLLVYKFEAFELFRNMLASVNKDLVSFLFRGGYNGYSSRLMKCAKRNRCRVRI